jgi:hypothetical protein
MEFENLIKKIKNLEKGDYENLKARICTDDKCELIRQEKKLEKIEPKSEKSIEAKISANANFEDSKTDTKSAGFGIEGKINQSNQENKKYKNHADFVTTKSNNMEVNKMEQKTLEKSVTDLTEEYKNKTSNEITRYDSSPIATSFKKVEKIDKKLNNFYSEIIGKEIPWKERYGNAIQSFLAKLKLGEMPDKIDIMTVFERRFEEVEEIADTLNDYTSDAFAKVQNLNGHVRLLRNEKIKLEKEYTQALFDADKLYQEAKSLEEQGTSLLPWKNNAPEELVLKLMDVDDAYKNAHAVYKNSFRNCTIRDEALGISTFYYDVMKEMANTGKQAYDDITLMVREMNTMIENAATCKDMMESIVTADKMLGKLSNYVGGMTKISLEYLGAMKDARVHKGEILPGKVTDGLKSKYNQMGNEREEMHKEITKAMENLPQYQKK